jgi:hypothetical protein
MGDVAVPSPLGGDALPDETLGFALERDSVDLSTYASVLAVLFCITPAVILLVRYHRLAPYLNFEGCARKMPFERLKQLILTQNGGGGGGGGGAAAKRRPFSQQLDAYLYTHTSWGYVLDVAQALLSLVSVALFIASSYRPPTEAEPVWAMVLELLLTLYFLADYFLRMYMAKDRLAYYFT